MSKSHYQTKFTLKLFKQIKRITICGSCQLQIDFDIYFISFSDDNKMQLTHIKLCLISLTVIVNFLLHKPTPFLFNSTFTRQLRSVTQYFSSLLTNILAMPTSFLVTYANCLVECTQKTWLTFVMSRPLGKDMSCALYESTTRERYLNPVETFFKKLHMLQLDQI